MSRTIFSDSQKCVPKSLLPTLTKASLPPTIRVCQDELGNQKKDKIAVFSQIDGSFLTDLEQVYSFMKNENHVLFCEVELNNSSVSEVTHCARVDSDLKVKLFFKSLPLPVPQWFRQGRDTRLSSKSMLQNLPYEVTLFLKALNTCNYFGYPSKMFFFTRSGNIPCFLP